MGEAAGDRPPRAGTLQSFARDLARGWRAWQRDPRLPAASIAIALITGIWAALVDVTGVAGLVVVSIVPAIYFLGFNGTELLWCVRLDRGASLAWSDVYRLTNGLRWRYFKLFVLLTIVGLVPTGAVFAATGPGATRTVLIPVVAAPVFVLFAFGFVSAAFNDVRTRDAARHSLTVLRHEWPLCSAYLVVPAVVFGAILPVTRAVTSGGFGYLALSLGVTAARLLCDCALAVFYADRYPTLRGGEPAHDAQLRTRGRRTRSPSAATRSAPPTIPPPSARTGLPLRRGDRGGSPFRRPEPPLSR